MRGFRRRRSRPIALRQGLSLLGVTLLLQGMEGFQTVVNLVLGVLTNATCIEENGVSVLLLVTYFVAGHLHHRGDHFAVGHVHRSEEHTSELQSRQYLVCRLLLEKKKKRQNIVCRILHEHTRRTYNKST